jgi:small conductance mechanosensitive channel
MLMFIAQMVLLGNVAAQNPPAAAADASATQPAAQLVQKEEAAAATTTPSQQQQSAIDRFKHTRLFELAEGKKTKTLHEMLQPEFWIDTIKELVVAALAFIPRLLVSVLFLFVFWLIYRACRRVLVGAMHRANVDPSIGDLMVALTKWSVMGFGLVIACNQIGIPIVAMLTGVSILGLAVGFAAQETLANFIAGIVIFWDKPFKVGDHLTVDGTRGEVQRITFRSTRLLNGDGEMIVFPNTYMLAHKVANHTTHPVTRVAITVGIAYSASIDQARAVLLDLLKGDDRILPEPAPVVVVAQLAESSVNLKLAFWVEDEKIVGAVTAHYNERIKNAFDAAGIEIPFPHVQLLVKESAAMRALPQDTGAPRPLAA